MKDIYSEFSQITKRSDYGFDELTLCYPAKLSSQGRKYYQNLALISQVYSLKRNWEKLADKYKEFDTYFSNLIPQNLAYADLDIIEQLTDKYCFYGYWQTGESSQSELLQETIKIESLHLSHLKRLLAKVSDRHCSRFISSFAADLQMSMDRLNTFYQTSNRQLEQA